MDAPALPASWVVLWSHDRCRTLKKSSETGVPLEVLYGAGHDSDPGFRCFGVQPGDSIYPVAVRDGVMYVISCLRVEGFLPVRQFLVEKLHLEAARTRWWEPAWREELWRERPELGHRIPYGCVSEAAYGPGEVPIRFDRAASPEVVEALSFRTREGEVRRPKYVENGRMVRTATMRGKTYRLCDPSAQAFDALVERLPYGHRPPK